jgi:hypothetical protein
MGRLTVRVGGCILTVAVLSTTARAEFITSMTGFQTDGGTINLGSSAPVGDSLFFVPGDSRLYSINGVILQQHVFADITFGGRVTGYSTGHLGITYTVGGGIPFFDLFFNTNPALGGFAELSISYDTWFVPYADPTRLEITGTVKLVSSRSSLYDFSGFTDGGTFKGTVFGNSDLNDLLVNGNGKGFFRVSSPNWEITASPVPPSIFLAGIGALGLVGYGWRRSRTAP